MDVVVTLAPEAGVVAAACAALGLSRATLHRRQVASRQPNACRAARPMPARALAASEREGVIALLRTTRFADQAPAEVYATLLDEGVFLCSIRTMYRILQESGEVNERRRQLRHPAYQKPELIAQAPNQV